MDSGELPPGEEPIDQHTLDALDQVIQSLFASPSTDDVAVMPIDSPNNQLNVIAGVNESQSLIELASEDESVDRLATTRADQASTSHHESETKDCT